MFVCVGFVGGARYSTSGGGSNHLCLESEPVFRPTDEYREYRSTVYGAEYRYPPNMLLEKHEVPCAVCQVTRRSVLMIPGTNLCKEGWTTEYVGQIAAERSESGRYRSEFVCVDDEAEMTPYSSPDNEDGLKFYPTQTRCGSLPCLPYADNKDLLCVVCSR